MTTITASRGALDLYARSFWETPLADLVRDLDTDAAGPSIAGLIAGPAHADGWAHVKPPPRSVTAHGVVEPSRPQHSMLSVGHERRPR